MMTTVKDKKVMRIIDHDCDDLDEERRESGFVVVMTMMVGVFSYGVCLASTIGCCFLIP